MAKFRRNHTRGRGGFSSISRSAGLLLLFFLLAFYLAKDHFSFDIGKDASHSKVEMDLGSDYLPAGGSGEVIHHKHFSLSYSEQHEQAQWVAYELTDQQIFAKNVKRTDWFEADPKVSTKSAEFADYRGSGYTKGHLVPSGDRNFSREANVETFYMSNISPQLRSFNVGVWNELEMTVRDWAVDHGRVYVITGPVLTDKSMQAIGKKNKVTAPKRFYKVVLRAGKNPQSIAFVIPNEKSERPLKDYITSVNDVEAITGLDFFANYLPTDIEDKVEAEVNVSHWPFDSSRFQKRIEVWNNQ